MVATVKNELNAAPASPCHIECTGMTTPRCSSFKTYVLLKADKKESEGPGRALHLVSTSS